MKEPLIFRSTIFDSRILKTGVERLSFFADDNDFEKSPSIYNTLDERDGIQWIFKNRMASAKYLFFDELNLKNPYYIFFDVAKPIIKDRDKPGDIDILLVDRNNISMSIAFQVKRIKGVINEDNSIKLKSNVIEHGIVQTKRMHEKYRFHKSYLMLIISVDSSNRKEMQSMFRYANMTEKQCVYEFDGFGDLPEDVGIYFYEINQPTNKSIELSSTLSAYELKRAKPIDQFEQTTISIRQLLREKGID